MQNLYYNQRQTALLTSARNSVVQPSAGDPFVGVYDWMTATEFNAMRAWYIQAVNDITALSQWNKDHSTNFVVTGKDENNNDVDIDVTDLPSDPFPIPPPKS